MNYDTTIILIELSLIIFWETTAILLIRTGMFDSKIAIFILMIISILSYVYLKKYLERLKR